MNKTIKHLMKRLLPLIIILTGLLIPTFVHGESGAPQIFGGQNANIGEYPYMARVITPSTISGRVFGCGGTLIHPRWVLTAAHCLRGINKDDNNKFYDNLEAEIIIGRRDLSTDEGTIVKSSLIFIHPDYDFIKNENDVALVYLSDSINGVELAEFDTNNSATGTATAIGWGADGYSSSGEHEFPSTRWLNSPSVIYAHKGLPLYVHLNGFASVLLK